MFGWVVIENRRELPAVRGCAAATTFVPAGAGVAGELMVTAALAALPFAEGHVDEMAKGGEHCEGGFEVAELADGDTHLRAPDADLGVVHAVDGAVFPFRRRGGEGGAVGVVSKVRT